MSDTIASASLETDVDRWLTEVGFRFNPFVYLDAGADPHIAAYLIGHDAFAALWGDWPALAFAPAGGGKTAQRVLVWRACWTGPDRGHPFPITYLPALSPSGQFPTTLAEHLDAILRASAIALLEALLLHPHWWSALDGTTRETARGLIERDLPAPLPYCLAQLQETQAVLPLFRSLGVASLPTLEPDSDRWLPVCSDLARTSSRDVPAATASRLQALLDLVMGPLSLSAVYLLVDGIDGFAETATNPAAAMALLQPLAENSGHWARRGLFVKGFLPAELAPAAGGAFAAAARLTQTTTLSWAPPRLAEVIRQRVYVATQGGFGSLDALCSPGLRDTETQLARIVAPLPREILVLTERLLWEHTRRGDASPKLTPADLQAAAAWYEEHRPPSAQPAAGVA